MEKIWGNLQFSTDLPQGESLKEALSSNYKNSIFDSKMDFKLTKNSTDYTSSFDKISYQANSSNRFNPNMKPIRSALASDLQNHQYEQNHTLFNLNIDLKKENRSLRTENKELQQLIEHIKHENYLDYQLIVDMCKSYQIPVDSADVKENLRKLISYFTVNNVKYEKQVKIFDVKYDNYSKQEIGRLNQKVQALEDELHLKNQMLQSSDDAYQKILIENAKLHSEIYSLQASLMIEKQETLVNQIKFDKLTLEQLEISLKTDQIIEFDQFSQQLFRVNQILNLDPKLTISEVLQQIVLTLIENKSQLSSNKLQIETFKAENIKQLPNRKIFPDRKIQQQPDDFAEEIQSILEINDLFTMNQNTHYQNEIQKYKRFIEKFQPILIKIGQIGKAMDYQGEQIEILEQLWQFILNQ